MRSGFYQIAIMKQPRRFYDVFVSFVAEDRDMIALCLERELSRFAVSAFVEEREPRVGDEPGDEKFRAMRQASVVVFILSPEFIASELLMEDVASLLQVVEDARIMGGRQSVLVPVLYRLSGAECQLALSAERGGDAGGVERALFDGHSFHGMSRPAWGMTPRQLRAAFLNLLTSSSIENVERATNEVTLEMAATRRKLVERIAKCVILEVIKSMAPTDEII